MARAGAIAYRNAGGTFSNSKHFYKPDASGMIDPDLKLPDEPDDSPQELVRNLARLFVPYLKTAVESGDL